MINKGYVRVDSIQYYGDGEEESISFLTEATMEEREGHIAICYSESECTGMENTDTCLAITKDSFDLSRKGQYEMQLHFEKNVVWDGLYQTPYGILHVKTKLLESKVVEEGTNMNICCRYEVQFEQEEKIGTELRMLFSQEKIGRG